MGTKFTEYKAAPGEDDPMTKPGATAKPAHNTAGEVVPIAGFDLDRIGTLLAQVIGELRAIRECLEEPPRGESIRDKAERMGIPPASPEVQQRRVDAVAGYPPFADDIAAATGEDET